MELLIYFVLCAIMLELIYVALVLRSLHRLLAPITMEVRIRTSLRRKRGMAKIRNGED